MTVAERMRRDGWRHLIGDMWMREMHGYLFVLSRTGDDQAPSGFTINPYCENEVNLNYGRRCGLRSLAQRAKAAARKLARRRSKR